jgi:hypothetical protein
MVEAPLAWEPMPFGSKRVDCTTGVGPKAWGADLEASLAIWRADGTTAVWINCPLAAAACLPEAAAAGFTCHHVEGDVVVLSLWLSTKTENKIPEFATHTVGVGGFVINDAGAVLVVKELQSGTDAQWKLPGGLADLGEVHRPRGWLSRRLHCPHPGYAVAAGLGRGG